MKKNAYVFLLALICIGTVTDAVFALRPLAEKEKRGIPERLARQVVLNEQKFIDWHKISFSDPRYRGINKKWPAPTVEYSAQPAHGTYNAERTGNKLRIIFYLANITSPEQLIELYWDAVADWFFDYMSQGYDIEAETEDFSPEESYLDSMRRDYIENCGIENGDTVLDVGTMNGGMAVLAARKTRGTVVGIDISQNCVHKARAYAEQQRVTNATFVICDILKFRQRFSGQRMDRVISNYTIMNEMPPLLRRKALREIFHIGRKSVTLFEYPASSRDPYSWTPDQWRRTMEEVGYTDVVIRIILADGSLIGVTQLKSWDRVVAYLIQAKIPSRSRPDVVRGGSLICL